MQNNNTPEFEWFYIELKQFHIFFGWFKGWKFIKVVNTLANNTFKHQITLNNKIILLIIVPTSYVFNISTNL